MHVLHRDLAQMREAITDFLNARSRVGAPKAPLVELRVTARMPRGVYPDGAPLPDPAVTAAAQVARHALVQARSDGRLTVAAVSTRSVWHDDQTEPSVTTEVLPWLGA